MSDLIDVRQGSMPARKDPSEGGNVPPLTDCGDDEDMEVKEAADILCSMKKAVIDKRTLDKLWETIERGRKSVRNDEDTEYVAPAQFSRPSNVIIQRNDGVLPRAGVEQIMGERSLPFEKVLTRSDVDDNQARLIIKKHNVERHLRPLLRENDDISKGISVKTYNPAGEEFPMIFKLWGEKAHVLMSGWNPFVLANGLKELQNCRVTIQAFRHATTKELCFLVSPFVC